MSDEKILSSKLEPIDDDLSLANKFGHIEKGGLLTVENKKESGDFLPEKEKAQETVGAEKDSAYDKILSKIGQNATDDQHIVKDDADVISKKMDAESKIQSLIDLAITKGVVHAVRVAKHLDDNYVLDRVHDKMITDEFHKVLVQKNLINEE